MLLVCLPGRLDLSALAPLVVARDRDRVRRRLVRVGVRVRARA